MSETIFGNWKPFKNDEKSFLFHLTHFRSPDLDFRLHFLVMQKKWFD